MNTNSKSNASQDLSNYIKTTVEYFIQYNFEGFNKTVLVRLSAEETTKEFETFHKHPTSGDVSLLFKDGTWTTVKSTQTIYYSWE